VDDPDIGDNIGIYGGLDSQRPTPSSIGKGNGNESEILEVFERLVGLLSGGWCAKFCLLILIIPK